MTVQTLYNRLLSRFNFAEVAELVDALVSKTNKFTLVPVRFRPSVPKLKI